MYIFYDYILLRIVSLRNVLQKHGHFSTKGPNLTGRIWRLDYCRLVIVGLDILDTFKTENQSIGNFVMYVMFHFWLQSRNWIVIDRSIRQLIDPLFDKWLFMKFMLTKTMQISKRENPKPLARHVNCAAWNNSSAFCGDAPEWACWSPEIFCPSKLRWNQNYVVHRPDAWF